MSKQRKKTLRFDPSVLVDYIIHKGMSQAQYKILLTDWLMSVPVVFRPFPSIHTWGLVIAFMFALKLHHEIFSNKSHYGIEVSYINLTDIWSSKILHHFID